MDNAAFTKGFKAKNIEPVQNLGHKMCFQGSLEEGEAVLLYSWSEYEFCLIIHIIIYI